MTKTQETAEKGYQGWTNYETWCVHLWLSNEQNSWNYYKGQAAELKAEVADEDWQHDIWTAEEYCRFTLADHLKEEIESEIPENLGGTIWNDLILSALSETNWYEIADAFLED